jgi:NADH-quinone oxidoreductase E subunit
MAWITENRRTATVERRPEPYLTQEMKDQLTRKYFPRYPTKRAVLLPALHMIQHAHGWIPMQALEEVGAFLGLQPAEVLDTATFYEEYWLRPKGQYLLQVCRSISCEICGSAELTDHLSAKLDVERGETTADGRFTLVELECLGACEAAPVMLINDALQLNLTTESVDQLIANLPADASQYRDPTVTWDEREDH